jgi:hypothetical protein
VGHDEFNAIIASYVDPSLVPGDYFTDSQVVLVYEGDYNPCDAHKEFADEVTVGTVTETSVKLIFSYREKARQDKCSAQPVNPFTFYQVKTKKDVITEQQIVP